jgi:hypothetical protein
MSTTVNQAAASGAERAALSFNTAPRGVLGPNVPPNLQRGSPANQTDCNNGLSAQILQVCALGLVGDPASTCPASEYFGLDESGPRVQPAPGAASNLNPHWAAEGARL